MDSKKFYLNKLSKLSSIIGDIKNKEFKISLARLIVFVILIVSAIYTFQVSLWIFFITLSILFLVFLFLIKHQISLKSKRIQLENRAAFYHNEINILDGKENICYNGSGLVNDKHAYAHDLDIIGKSSIYEKINRSKTYFGTHYLSRFLLSFPNHNEVHERQEAIAEISTLDDWREKFHGSLFGLTDQYNFNISSVLEENLNFEYDFFKKKSLQIIVKLVPIIWLFLFLIYFYFGANFKPILIGFGMLIFVLYFKYAKEIGKIQLALSKSIENFVAYTEALNWIFEASWKSPLLQSTISPYRKTKENEQVAVKELVDLKKLIDLLDYRLNMIVGIILNLFLLWDFRIIIKIGRWKEKNNFKVKELFSVIGLFETLSSLAIWKFNNPEYCQPIVSEGKFSLKCQNLRHPLINKALSVGNAISLDEKDYINIITGSNMSGKSTFLRAIGVNIVLGNAGTVCSADKFSYHMMQIMTYMRIKDSLEENASTFKAELDRIKQMLEILESNENTLLLIDEMLRGTNSKDKLKGSIAVAKKILDSKTHCIIATHDLQLTKLEKEAPQYVNNYYFDIDFEAGELRFDYKLKPGVCQNFNASYLLEKIGINTNPAI